MSAPDQLFPTLPPELRNEIYAHTVTPDDPATNIALPFTNKKYDICGTALCIYPVHSGAPALLALAKDNVLEATEYKSYLLTNAMTLRLALVVKVQPQIFTHQHWAAKLRTHIAKLIKKYNFLADTRRLEIKIFWEPKGGCWMDARHDCRVPAMLDGIVRELAGVFPPLRGGHLRDVRVALHVEAWAQHRLRPVMGQFVAAKMGVSEKRVVVFERREKGCGKWVGGVGVEKNGKKMKDIMKFGESGEVDWGEKCDGDVVMEA